MKNLLTIYPNSVAACNDGCTTEYLLELLNSSRSKSVIINDILKLCAHRENVAVNSILVSTMSDIDVMISKKLIKMPAPQHIIIESAFDGDHIEESITTG
jgi:predicted transcriptional regulator